ncbi:MAG TPA: cytochrome P450 [Streptosporangiaceae bacterium]|nr:cytochrome P450 [Streptosporangiaceae bacterium]
MTLADTPFAFPFKADSLYHPAPQWAELRERRPVAEIRMPDGTTAWLVTRTEDVRQVFFDQRFSRAAAAAAATAAGQGGVSMAAGSESIIGMDGPEHTRLRSLVAGTFTIRRTEWMRPKIRTVVHELLDGLQAQPQPADLVRHFSLPLPIRVLCEVLGVPPEDHEVFRSSAEVVVGDEMRDPEQSRVFLKRLLDYFDDLIAKKRDRPADDLITVLVQARDVDGKLSEHELRLLCLVMLIAGYESTSAEINMFVLTLLRHPREWARLKAQPDLLPQAVEELLRFAQLTDVGTGFPRVTTEEVELSGVTIPAGAVVLPAFIPASRDPALFDEPDRLDLMRGDKIPHFGFGAGAHRCLGAGLARVELQEAMRGLLTRLPDLRLGVPESDLRLMEGRIVHTFEALPVSW